MHHDRGGRQPRLFQVVSDLLDDIKVQRLLPFELVSAVAGADRCGQRIAVGLLDKFDRLVRVGQAGVTFVHFDVFFDSAEHAELGFHADPFGVGASHHAFGDFDIFVEWSRDWRRS